MDTHNQLTVGKDKGISILNTGLNKERRYIDVSEYKASLQSTLEVKLWEKISYSWVNQWNTLPTAIAIVANCSLD